MKVYIRDVFEGLAAVRSLNRGCGKNRYVLKFYGHGLFGIVS